MSIHDEINFRCGEKRLVLLQPFLGSAPRARTVFTTPDVHSFLVGPWPDKATERQANRARAHIDMFIEGAVITVGLDPHKKLKSCWMARTDPVRDEVFAIRSRGQKPDTRPGTRIMAAFADTDVLIALAWDFRLSLKARGSREWRAFIELGKRRWTQLFPTIPPHRGDSIHAYISTDAFFV